MPSPSAWAPEVPCARCHTRVAGLSWGERCRTCQALRLRRANRLASRISLAATLVVGFYVMTRLPTTPSARWIGVIAVVVTYAAVRKIAQRVAMETMPD
jgi:hypothetical protein